MSLNSDHAHKLLHKHCEDAYAAILISDRDGKPNELALPKAGREPDMNGFLKHITAKINVPPGLEKLQQYSKKTVGGEIAGPEPAATVAHGHHGLKATQANAPYGHHPANRNSAAANARAPVSAASVKDHRAPSVGGNRSLSMLARRGPDGPA